MLVTVLPFRVVLTSCLVATMIAISPSSLSAVGPSKVTGAWVMSVDSPQSPDSIGLEVVHRSDAWSVTLRSNAGVVTTSLVNLEEDILSFQYGVKPFDARVELTVAGESMSGSVVTGEGETRHRRSISAHRATLTDEDSALKQNAESKRAVEQAREFMGAWELSLRRISAEPDDPISMGMVVADLDGKLIVGHSRFSMKGPQKRVDDVQITNDGLRWALDGDVFGPLNVNLAADGDALRVNINSGQQPLLTGTAIHKPNASDVAVDRAQLIQNPGTEVVGVIGEQARVVEVDGDVLVIRQGEVVSRILKGDPLLLLFEWFRLPQKSHLISAKSNIAWSVTGSKIQSWDIRNSQHPSALGNCDVPGNPPKLAHRAGDLVFATNWNGRADTQQVQVVDVSDPGNPILVASHSTPKGATNYDLTVSGSTLYLANAYGLRITDVTNQRAPVLRGIFEGRGRWVRGVDVVGSTAYIATSMHGGASWLQVVDVSDPTAPVQTGIYRSTGGSQDVSVSGDLAVVADRAAGIVVLDVSDPQNVRRVGYSRTIGHAKKVDIFGELAFVADGVFGLKALHVIRYTEQVE